MLFRVLKHTKAGTRKKRALGEKKRGRKSKNGHPKLKIILIEDSTVTLAFFGNKKDQRRDKALARGGGHVAEDPDQH